MIHIHKIGHSRLS